MKKTNINFITKQLITLAWICSTSMACATTTTVTPVYEGENLWKIVKRIAYKSDDLESKLDIIISILDELDCGNDHEY